MADKNLTVEGEDADDLLRIANGPRLDATALHALPGDDILHRLLDIAYVVADCEEEAAFRRSADQVLVDIE